MTACEPHGVLIASKFDLELAPVALLRERICMLLVHFLRRVVSVDVVVLVVTEVVLVLVA